MRSKATIDHTAPAEAAELLGHVAAARAQARSGLGTPWFPLVLFGGVSALGGGGLAAVGADVLPPLWAAALVVGAVALRRHHAARARRVGVAARARRSWWIGGGMAVACFVGALVGGRVGGLATALSVPLVLTAVGYALLAAVQGTTRVALWVAVASAAGLVALLAGWAPWLVEVLFGGALAALGLTLRATEGRP